MVSTFKDHPENFEWTLSRLKRLDAQKQMVYGFPKELDLQMEYTVFSDSIVLSSRIPEDPVNTSLYQIALTCSLLLKSGLFARGAVVDGYLYHKNNIILGQGIIDSYNKESAKAIYPRVIVSENIIERYQTEIQTYPLKKLVTSWANTLIRKDEDDCYFLDTLQSIPNSLFKEDYIPFLKTTRNRIIDKLGQYRSDEKVFPKYEWFRRYYNASIAEHPEYGLEPIRRIDS